MQIQPTPPNTQPAGSPGGRGSPLLPPPAPVTPGTPVVITPGREAIAAWQTGQVLAALVMRENSGGLALRIGDATVRPETPIQNLQVGQQVRLQVVERGDRVVLQLLQGSADIRSAALRTALPNQGPMGPLLSNLNALFQPTQTAAAIRGELPPQLVQMAQNVVNNLPTQSQLATPEGLREAIRNAGVLLESRLAQAANHGERPQLSQDLKAGLMQLLYTQVATQQAMGQSRADNSAMQALFRQLISLPPSSQPATATATATPPPATGTAGAPPTPLQGALAARAALGMPPLTPSALTPPLKGMQPQPQPPTAVSERAAMTPRMVLGEMIQQTTAALSRIQLHQLASLPTDEGPRQQLNLELPMRLGDGIHLLHMQIEREPDDPRQPERPPYFTVRLAFDPGDAIGPLRITVTLIGEHVSTVFWAEREEGARQLRERMGELREQLEAAGVKVGRVACHEGLPPEPTERSEKPQLVDEEA